MDGKVIWNDATGAVEVDGHGGYLLPGFIDAHLHLMGVESPDELLKYGVRQAASSHAQLGPSFDSHRRTTFGILNTMKVIAGSFGNMSGRYLTSTGSWI
jgi:imidazolonepropionase-like amidohydrolase